MSDKVLVIVESKAKATTIGKYLNKGKGKRYVVRACLGHVRDLPKSTLGIDIDKNFALRYSVSPDRKDIVAELQAEAADSDEILLATDPDREGEAIAWHLDHILRKPPTKKPAAKGTKAKPAPKVKAEKRKMPEIRRIEFHEITQRAIEEAMKHPREINGNVVDAQQARRVLDRLVGYSLSPYLWREIQGGLSAGRVQSVALRLICDREAEIEAFKPEEYWSITGHFAPSAKPGSKFHADLVAVSDQKIGLDPSDFKLNDKRITDEILGRIRAAHYTVGDVKVSDLTRKPQPPYKTSTLQQDGSKKLGLSPREVMRLAQQLYEGLPVGPEGQVGLITYMRTDSTRLADDALTMARDFIGEQYGPAYLPEKPQRYEAVGKGNVQDAHEAIRPTDVKYTPERLRPYLDSKQLKVYEMIWRRFVACQMMPCIETRRTITITGAEFTFRASQTDVKFDGYRRVMAQNKRDEQPLPEVAAADPLTLNDLKGDQHFTQPPPRYTNASLVKTLEEEGIGRPSTYAPTLSTIRTREYVSVEKGTFFPTPLGRQVDALLKSKFPDIIQVDFTRRMEANLDQIESHGRDWVAVIRDFYGPFQQDLTKALGEFCHKCNSPLLLKNGPFGTYMACSSAPACDYSKNLAEVELEEQCPDCQSPLQIKMGRFGKFVACTNYPGCKYTRNLGKDGSAAPVEKVYSETPCPDCGGKLVLRTSRAGRFWGCESYPTCKGLLPFTLDVKCPKCGKPLSERRVSKGRAKGKAFYGCTGYPTCDFISWVLPKADENGVAIIEEKAPRAAKKATAKASVE
ncbi:MAG: type I DNA topoisomerase [bacterium]